MKNILLLPLLLCACAAAPARPDLAALKAEVEQTERAFAKTMADRDLAGFASHLADDTVFFGSKRVLRGKAAVVDAWKPFYEGAQAPFSWAPERVEVLDSGDLAYSSGPVFDPEGNRVSSFNSVWQREAPGIWRIVFDKGCDCPP